MKKLLFTILLLSAALSPMLYQPVERRMPTNGSQTNDGDTPGISMQLVYAMTNSSTTPVFEQLAYEHRPDGFDYRTNSFMLGEDEEVSHPLPFPFEQENDHICLYYDYFVFRVAAGQEVRLTFQTSNQIGFYLVTLQQLDSFYHYFCGHYTGPSEGAAFSSSLNLNWVAHKSGLYVFLFTSERPYGAYTAISLTAEISVATVQTTTS